MLFDRRQDWGAKPPRSRVPFRSKDKIAIHWWGANVTLRNHEDCRRVFRDGQRLHMARGGLGTRDGASDIAYNAGACPHGYVLEGRGPNVANGANGESAHNLRIAAVVYLGGPGQAIPESGMRALRDAVLYMHSGGFPLKGCGHRDLHQTECPGSDLYNRIPDLFKTPSLNRPEPSPSPAPRAPVTTEIGTLMAKRTSFEIPLGDEGHGWAPIAGDFNKAVGVFVNGPHPERDGYRKFPRVALQQNGDGIVVTAEDGEPNIKVLVHVTFAD